jgi:hypothetical protein
MPDPLAKPNRPKPNPLEGAALIIVLSCLVLLAALAIGLLNRVEADRANASAYRGSTQTRNLAEYAINVVMAQISGATKSDPTLAWASQPGAIRTYSATSTNLQAIYKLYSSTNMVASNAAAANIVTGDVAALAGWANNTALFTDLNAPVISGSGATNYPILDPAATNSVEGFDIIGAPTTPTQPAPMPVNWLYVLEDGTLVPPTTSAGNNTVTVTGATAANPIVGRIAFWTDDDTSKININTASGAPWNYTNTTVTTTWESTRTVPTPANFWDTPFSKGIQEINLALAQPWAGEYQRYPGHPASVSLSAVFTNLTTNDIMAIAPRITYQNNLAGSLWGSRVATNSVTSADLGNPAGVTTLMRSPDSARSSTAYRMSDDASRLYANVDELLFATNRSAGGTNSVTPQQLEQARFFLTASSRAPDVTLFNTPRILVWPITSSGGSTTKMTPYDKLIAFCGTLGANTNIGSTNSYYFTRSNPGSATADYGVQRNQDLIAYFRRMTTQAVPGFGGSSGILGKYNSIAPGESEQITTQIFDYIRCINTRDQSMETNISAVNTDYYFAARSTIIPTSGTNDTRGFGRFPTITKVGVHFWYNTNFVNTELTPPTTNASLYCRVLLEPFFATHGYPSPGSGPSGNFRYNVSGLRSLLWGVGNSTTTNIFASDTATSSAGTPWQRGGRGGAQVLVTTSSTTNAANLATRFSTNTAATFYFGGGNLVISVSDIGGSVTNQVINVTLPPIPSLPMPTSNSTTNRTTDRAGCFFTNDVVRAVAVSHGDYRLTAARPIVPTNAFVTVDGGTNAYQDSSSAQRIAHNFLADFPYTYHGRRFPTQHYYNTNNSTFTSAINVTDFVWASSDAATTNAQPSVNGDFDNGYGNAGDGPYIGFADEGNSRLYRFIYANEAIIRESIPYLDGSGGFRSASEGLFSPNRLVPSAGIMSSLPTGVISQTPWQTLLFRPAALTSATHPGLNNPPDYLLLDLFNMPVVEPYAISEPLSTAGRVNMNYQILPFTYIKRSTALQAALHTERLGVIPNLSDTGLNLVINQYRKYTISNFSSRLSLNLNTNTGTLRGFEDRFANNDIFRSAAEICSIPLVPTNSTWSAVTGGTFWPNYSPTGENTKERPYARIYPKLTTKSNTYTVHYRVEVLKKSPNSTTQTTWADGTDKVISTYRGSTTIERYVNPRDSLPDYADLTTLPPTGANALPNFYKFRILGERQFNP